MYYAYSSKDEILISDDFFEVCAELHTVTKNKKNIQHFLDHWTFPTGRTFFNEIHRMIPQRVYQLINGKLLTKPRVFKKVGNTFSDFKETLFNTLTYESDSETTNGIFFSGGVDSLLLASGMEKLGLQTKLYTGFSHPEFDSSDTDLNVSDFFANKYNWDLKQVKCNFKNIDISIIDSIIYSMPMSSHVSLMFLKLSQAMKKDGVTKAFSGQNMDSLYNLGPTTPFSINKSSIADSVRRSFLTDNYFNTVSERSLASSYDKLFYDFYAQIISKAYGFFKGTKFTPPRSASELVDNYKKSNDYVIFSKSGLGFTSNENINIRDELITYKVENFLMSGAPQVIHSSSNLNDIKCSLPYSSNLFVNYFRSNAMTYVDILKPKKHVYQCLKEFGINYSDIKIDKKKNNRKQKTYHDWSSSLLSECLYGQTLVSELHHMSKKSSETEAQFLQRLLSNYWVKKVFEKVEKICQIY